jgi:Flp pilus assembly pilin Flp
MLHALDILWNDESGQGLPEYALLVAVACVMTVTATGVLVVSTEELFDDISAYITASSSIAT